MSSGQPRLHFLNFNSEGFIVASNLWLGQNKLLLGENVEAAGKIICLPPQVLCNLHTELPFKVMGIDHLLTSVLLPTGGFRHIGPLTGTSFSFSIKILLYINNDKHSNATFLNVKFFTIYPDTVFVKYIPQPSYKLD